jgi:hypothetical protein
MWKNLAFSFAIFITFLVHAESPEENETAIRAKMLELAGPTAIQCGLLRRGQRLEPAWKCAQIADKSQKPFWLAVEGYRFDSAVWLAIARGPGGKRYRVFYSSNDAGEADFAPSFHITDCHERFQLFRKSLFFMRCGPDVP